MKKMIIKIKNKISLIIKNIIGKHIIKKQNKIYKKLQKCNYASWWFFDIVGKEKYLDVSLKNRLKMYIKGFTSDEYVIYNLERNNINEYITDMERWKSREINGSYNIVLDDKRLFYETFSRYIKIPKTLFFIKDGKFLSYESEGNLEYNKIFELLKIYKGIVIRPINSGGGKNIKIVKIEEDEILINNEKSSEKELEDLLSNQYDAVVSEFIFQHKYANEIFDKSVNTIRIVTTIDENGKANIPVAVHRFGTIESIPVDNACSGGIFAMIDIETGIIGTAKSYRSTEEYKIHPYTKTKIEGVVIPRWEEIKKKVIYVAQKFPYIKFIAWDIALTDNDIIAIEGNTSSDLNLYQIFKPLKNSKLGEFYRNNNIIIK